MTEKIKLNIDGIDVEVEKGTTVLQAARKANIDIPTLCFLKGINAAGDCRMCIVEIEGRRALTPSCNTLAEDGMIVRTNTDKVNESRRIVLDLILSTHNRDCLTCVRNGNCELQELCKKFGITEVEYEGEKVKPHIDDLSPSIVRDASKCIMCKRCVAACKNIQNISAIDVAGRGYESRIAPTGDKSLNEVNCTFCGQCIQACPVGALKEKDDTQKVWRKIRDKETYTVVQVAPAVRVALGEEFGMPIGTNVKGKMVTALRKIGFDKVFDTNTGADFTIVEEANEFIEMNYPELLGNLSSCKSPHQMFGAILKSYYAEKEKIDPKKMFVVSVMPCVAKKFERTREEMKNDGLDNVDAVITTREFARMIKQANIDFTNLEETDFDNPMGEATGAAAIFGTTGGVMEAALRTAHEAITGRELKNIDFVEIRGARGIKKASVTIDGKEIKVVVAHGLSNARKVLDEIKAGKADYQFVEIMACPGGCIMGGGQPIVSSKKRMDVDVRKLRAEALYTIDKQSELRKSHENPTVIKIYKEYLGDIGGHKAHELLHTYYTEREKYKL